MEFKKLRNLSAKQRREIEILLKDCKETNSFNETDYYMAPLVQEEKELPCFFLKYREDVLVAAIFLYYHSKDESEVIGYTNPRYRRQGHFTFLLNQVKQTMSENNITRIIFLLKAGENEAVFFVKAQGAVCISREYLLEYNPQCKQENNIFLRSALNEKQETIEIQPANINDLESLSGIYKETNFETGIIGCDWLEYNLNDPQTAVYKLVRNHTIIGTASVAFGRERDCIFAVAVDLDVRGQGYGKLLLLLLLEELKPRNQELVLQVSDEAEKAVKLYFDLGFEIIDQTDCYSIKLSTLE